MFDEGEYSFRYPVGTHSNVEVKNIKKSRIDVVAVGSPFLEIYPSGALTVLSLKTLFQGPGTHIEPACNKPSGPVWTSELASSIQLYGAKQGRILTALFV